MCLLHEIENKDYSFDVETNSINSASFNYFSTSVSTNNLSMDQLQEYIKYPMIYNAILREISKQAYNNNGMYARAIDTRVALPLLSYVTVFRNKDSIKKKKEKNRKSNIHLIMKLLNHEKTTRDILRRLDIDGYYVGILRDTKPANKQLLPTSGMIETISKLEGLSLSDNFMIQPLDLDYCKIIGFQNNYPIAAFDMMYFDQYKHGGLLNEIKNFPRDFMLAYLKYKKDASNRWYILNYKSTIAVVSRSSTDESYGRPYGLASFADIKMQTDYTNNQYKLVNELASSIYYMVLPQGEKIGTCSLNKDQQTSVISSFQNAVKLNTNSSTANISTLTLPPNTTVDRLSKDSSLLKDTLSNENIKKISTSLGFASSALNASSEGSSSFAALQVNLDILSSQVFQAINNIASEYTRVINEYQGVSPSNYIDIKYLPISYLNKNDIYNKAKELYMVSGGSRTYMIAAAGFDPYDYLCICDEEIEDKLDDKYQPHITSYTASDSSDKSNPNNNLGGRPQKESKDLGFNGAVTKGTGSNENLKPSTK